MDNYYDQPPQNNYYQDPYSVGSPSNQAQFTPPKKIFWSFLPSGFNRFESLIIVLCLSTLTISFLIGYFQEQKINRDLQRQEHIEKVVQALDAYYLNSSKILSARKYPVSSCSSRLNPVDYEFTVKQHLTGKRKEFSTNNYLEGFDFPNDPKGIYSETFESRKIDLTSCPSQFNNTAKSIYPDKTASCNFSSGKDKKYKMCYTYASSSVGDQYQIAYYSEAKGKFQIYSKLRNEDLIDLNNPPKQKAVEIDPATGLPIEQVGTATKN
jgi:hypothetical protein